MLQLREGLLHSRFEMPKLPFEFQECARRFRESLLLGYSLQSARSGECLLQEWC